MTIKTPKLFLFSQTIAGYKLSWIQKGIIIHGLRDFKIRSVKSTTRRPEHRSNAQSFYRIGAKTYAIKPRVLKIQKELYQKAVKLLDINSIQNSKPIRVLDLGCGIGLFSQYLQLCGMLNLDCAVIGVDVSHEMLNKTLHSNNFGYTSLICNDIGQGLPFRSNTVDAAISISTLQWLMGSQNTMKLSMFFESLRRILTQSGRAVIQFYPNSYHDVEALIDTASRYFNGALVADFPHNDDAVKLFLCLENCTRVNLENKIQSNVS